MEAGPGDPGGIQRHDLSHVMTDMEKSKPPWSLEMLRATKKTHTVILAAKEDEGKCESAAERGMGSGDKGHGEGRDAECLPCVGFYW